MPGKPTGVETCWTLIRAAAAGEEEDRSVFAHRYLPVVRSYLGVRWESSVLRSQLDDAVQEVFLECFRRGGVLARVDPDTTTPPTETARAAPTSPRSATRAIGAGTPCYPKTRSR